MSEPEHEQSTQVNPSSGFARSSEAADVSNAVGERLAAILQAAEAKIAELDECGGGVTPRGRRVRARSADGGRGLREEAPAGRGGEGATPDGRSRCAREVRA